MSAELGSYQNIGLSCRIITLTGHHHLTPITITTIRNGHNCLLSIYFYPVSVKRSVILEYKYCHILNGLLTLETGQQRTVILSKLQTPDPVLCLSEVSGSTFIWSMKILVTVFALSHSSHSLQGHDYHSNSNIQRERERGRERERLDKLVYWLTNMVSILCHGESASRVITEIIRPPADTSLRCSPPSPSSSPPWLVTEWWAVSQNILMTWPRLPTASMISCWATRQ